MKITKTKSSDVDYILDKPKRINWVVIAGPGLSPIQSYDLVFDDYDLKIRQIKEIL